MDVKKMTNEEIDKFLAENWTEWHDALFGMVLRKGDRRIRAVDANRLLNISLNNWKEMNLDSLYAELLPLLEDEGRRKQAGKLWRKIDIPEVRQKYPQL